MSNSPDKKPPLTVAERKRRQREKSRKLGKQGVELELSHDLKAKLEWAASKQGLTLKDYIAKYLDEGHSHIA